MNSSTTRVSFWRRLSRFSFSDSKISRPLIRRFLEPYATTARVLILHPEEGLSDFPNRYIVSKRADDKPDLLVDFAFEGLSAIPSESYPLIVCCGLLEHIPDPQRFIDELHRILEPGGKVLVSASACFSFHQCPDDYFHYTPFSLRLLFKKWSRFEVLRGNCGPFTTIGILLQRILLQCEIFPPLRPVIELFVHAFPLLDRFVIRQYNRRTMDPAHECDSMLPSNMQAVVVK
ncbi:MAG: methyltransferase domain-containing protein [Vicinamibacterales bacterium]